MEWAMKTVEMEKRSKRKPRRPWRRDDVEDDGEEAREKEISGGCW